MKSWYFERDCPFCTRSASCFCRKPLNFLAHAMWMKWWYHANFKAFQTNSEKVECWHGIIIWPTYHVQESREGYGKNWMHFVYKTNNLLRSIRVSYENSSVTKRFRFFWTYLNSIVFLCSKCTIQSHIINFQPFLTSFVIFHAFTGYFEL